MDEQREIEAKIDELEELLKNVEVVYEGEIDSESVNIGSLVTILNLNNNKQSQYQIVGTTGANALLGKISNESPVGKALLGKAVGDVVDIETAAGELKYKVLEILR